MIRGYDLSHYNLYMGFKTHGLGLKVEAVVAEGRTAFTQHCERRCKLGLCAI